VIEPAFAVSGAERSCEYLFDYRDRFDARACTRSAFPTAAERIHPDLAGYEQFILDHQAIKRHGRAEEVASVLSFLCGPDASFITGQTIAVDGGWWMP
jgi:NAD(P)-dependent dehydrogenase (short-subunit alcohol dehydrogenase family)